MKNSTYNFEDISELISLLHKDVIDSPQLLIQVFCADTNVAKIESMQAYFRNNFPSSTLIGTTTDGIINKSKVYVNSKNVVTFTQFYKTTLSSALMENSNIYSSSYETGKQLAKKIICEDTQVIISFADGIHTNGEEYIKGISSVSSDITLSGGLAADNGQILKTYVFDKNSMVSNGAVGVALSSKDLHVSTSYTFDWMPIGKEMLVTKAIKNRVYEIDGISTVDIYKKYMGPELAENLPQVGIEFPLIMVQDGVSVGRAVLFKHDDGSLTFAGNIKEGEKVRFGVGNIETILKNSDYNVQKMLDTMPSKSEALFVYSCMARRRFMKNYIDDELEVLSSIGNVSGFFTYGEFFSQKGSTQLLNETMTILSLSESSEAVSRVVPYEGELTHHFGVDAQHVLAHLANIVSNELAELNSSLEHKILESSEYIYHQAYYDRLTGLPNRLSLIKKLEESLGKMVLLINIDDFTTINDFYGHEVGDMVLKQLSSLLIHLVHPESAEVFKLPSDEFAIIMNTSNIKGSMENRIKQCITSIKEESFLVKDGHYAHVSVTISAALVNENKTGLVNADMTLKLAKKAGVEYMIFDDDLELSKQYEQNILMANKIKDAINSDKILPYFQPLFDMKKKKITKYEALVRLQESETKILSPFEFLETSQKIKLYPQITRIMIQKTFDYFSKTTYEFSINLSFSDILNVQTREYLFSKIKEFNIASQLTIEILETQEKDNDAVVGDFIDKVYECGANIAIDDFGSGYANFEHMTKMRSDYMKIDGSLIKNINTDKNARLVVETIIIFARKLNKKIVAEFVHSQEVFDVVEELGVDYAQGYFIGKPEPKIL